MSLKLGTTVTMHSPGTIDEHESWTRGVIRETLAVSKDGTYALHVVRNDAFKWDLDAPWGV